MEGETRSSRTLERVRGALERARGYLSSLQAPDGHWCAELEGDTILESEYALTLWFLGRGETGKFQRLANYLRARQDPAGGWSNFPGGPPEISVSVKAYFVLKLAGDAPEAAHMRAARRSIRRLGGLDACNSYTRILLSVFGVYEWERAPAVPPEIVLLPRWFPFDIYEMSAWSRAIVVPLSIIWARKPYCPVPRTCRLDELRVAGARARPARVPRNRTEKLWSAFFVRIDIVLKAIERAGVRPLRGRALRRAEAWVLERLEGSDGLGAIFPSIMNTVMALVCQGRPTTDPVVQGEIAELEKLEIADGDELRIQPCFSPVWDTALAMNALLDAGLCSTDETMQRGARWLLDKEARRPGDWKCRNPDAQPGGWYFEYANDFYPDCDDTAEVLALLQRVPLADPEANQRRREALERGLAWQLSMQSRNGGWGAFDKDCDRRVLELVPFADHNAMLDPPTVDVTARTLEALIEMGLEASDPRVRRGVDFILREQEPEGCWYGRWGANYIYGTWLALTALGRVGVAADSPVIRRAVEWFLWCQNEDGGWGESLWSYHDPSTKGQGPTTASQTAWALMGLLAPGGLADARVELAVRRGVEYLLSSQRRDGSWYDAHWTGTGFPKVFYLRYHLYACYFPLQALAMYARALELKRGADKAA